MKNLLFTLALLVMAVSAFAQTQLADEWPAMTKARNADNNGWLQTHTTPNMTFIAGNDGSLQNKDWMMGLFKNQKSHKVDFANVKIQQVGDLGVATGISTIVIETLDGKKQSYKDAFTYTLRWYDGKWMFTNFHHTKIEYK